MVPHLSHSRPRYIALSQALTLLAKTKAGLVNYTRQRHDVLAQVQLPCPLRNGLFKKQGINNYMSVLPGKIHSYTSNTANYLE